MTKPDAKKIGTSGRKNDQRFKKSFKSAENVSDDSTDSESGSGSESSGSSDFGVNGIASKGATSNGTKKKRSGDSTSAYSGTATTAPLSTAILDSERSDREPDSESQLGSESDGMDVEGTSEKITKAADDATRNLLAARTYTSDFEPPTGFSHASEKGELRVSASLQKVLSGSGTGSKQIWHISAPANISLSRLENVSIEGIAKGERVLTHKGIDYCLKGIDWNGAESTSLVVPTDEKYSRINVPVARSVKLQGLNLQKHADNADHFMLDEASVVATKTYSKAAPPEQPRGLRYRYQPLGVVEERKTSTAALPTKKVKQRDETHARPGPEQETREDRVRRKAEKKARRELKEKKRSAKGST